MRNADVFYQCYVLFEHHHVSRGVYFLNQTLKNTSGAELLMLHINFSSIMYQRGEVLIHFSYELTLKRYTQLVILYLLSRLIMFECSWGGCLSLGCIATFIDIVNPTWRPIFHSRAVNGRGWLNINYVWKESYVALIKFSKRTGYRWVRC